MLGQITARAEAHTIRLALLYALADGKRQISPPHLDATLALHDYATRSAGWALHGTTGEPLAEQIHATLRNNPSGLTGRESGLRGTRRPAPQPDAAQQAHHESPAHGVNIARMAISQGQLPYARSTQRQVGGSRGGGMEHAISALLDVGELVEDREAPGGYAVVDPLLAYWVRAGRHTS